MYKSREFKAISTIAVIIIVIALLCVVLYRLITYNGTEIHPVTPLEKKWEPYYEKTQYNESIEPVYLQTIMKLRKKHPDRELRAADIGTGTGTVAAVAASTPAPKGLECGVRVTAEDINQTALDYVKKRIKGKNIEKCISTRQRDIALTPNPDKNLDLIFLRAVLPFLSLSQSSSIQKVIDINIANNLSPDGCAVVEFLGENHPWCGIRQDVRCHSIEEVEDFFANFPKVVIVDTTRPLKPAEEDEKIPWNEITVVACNG